ncbi:MAG: hypothetical protein R2854_10410 [Caldilineaceae bacterium]
MPKLMLLTTDRSYRNNAFFQAAQRLDIDVLPVVDMTPALAAQWPQRIGVDFGRPDDAAEALAAIARRTMSMPCWPWTTPARWSRPNRAAPGPASQ